MKISLMQSHTTEILFKCETSKHAYFVIIVWKNNNKEKTLTAKMEIERIVYYELSNIDEPLIIFEWFAIEWRRKKTHWTSVCTKNQTILLKSYKNSYNIPTTFFYSFSIFWIIWTKKTNQFENLIEFNRVQRNQTEFNFNEQQLLKHFN